jgi:argonaute-like protein implicated in RNA metabolism and viral defense
MLNKGSPIQVSMSNDRLKRVFLTVDGKNDNELVNDAISINDNSEPHFTQKERERELKKLFRSYGHSITFIGRTVRQ